MAEKLFWAVLDHLGRLSPEFIGAKARGRAHRFKVSIQIVDTTVIELVASAMDWARHRPAQAAATTQLPVSRCTRFMQSATQLFRSRNTEIRVRAARVLLERDSEIPLSLLLEVLDEFWDRGLGAKIERVLLTRHDPELLQEMITRLHSPGNFIRELACTVLGRIGDPAATEHLLQALHDPVMMVRRAAGFALAHLRDKSCAGELLRQYEIARDDDTAVRFALECALRELGVEYVRHPDRTG